MSNSLTGMLGSCRCVTDAAWLYPCHLLLCSWIAIEDQHLSDMLRADTLVDKIRFDWVPSKPQADSVCLCSSLVHWNDLGTILSLFSSNRWYEVLKRLAPEWMLFINFTWPHNIHHFHLKIVGCKDLLSCQLVPILMGPCSLVFDCSMWWDLPRISQQTTQQRPTYLIDASATFTRGLSRSSFSLVLSSCNLRSLRSAIDCFLLRASPPSFTAYAGGIVSIYMQMMSEDCLDCDSLRDGDIEDQVGAMSLKEYFRQYRVRHFSNTTRCDQCWCPARLASDVEVIGWKKRNELVKGEECGVVNWQRNNKQQALRFRLESVVSFCTSRYLMRLELLHFQV